MKILWFTNTPSMFDIENGGYNGGGWIESLEANLNKMDDMQLGVCFFHKNQNFKIQRANTTYYPISIYNSFKNRIRRNFSFKRTDENEIGEFLKIIEDFKPDLIHIFGTEQSFGLITQHTDVPVLIHVQGILNPYLNAWFPPNTNQIDYLLYFRFDHFLKKKLILKKFKYNAEREIKIVENCNFFGVRTLWDEAFVNLISKKAEVFYCSEILRSAFYDAKSWSRPNSLEIRLITTISKVEYKGFDLILKTAKILKYLNVKIIWDVYGIDEYSFWEKKANIFVEESSINLRGIVTSEVLIRKMQESNFYIHPSYIDNSPNSVCEAQIIGLPIISTNVGGISSLIEHNVTGCLIPSNDPYFLASTILKLSSEISLVEKMSVQGREVAIERHDVSKILEQNISAYKSMLKR